MTDLGFVEIREGMPRLTSLVILALARRLRSCPLQRSPVRRADTGRGFRGGAHEDRRISELGLVASRAPAANCSKTTFKKIKALVSARDRYNRTAVRSNEGRPRCGYERSTSS